MEKLIGGCGLTCNECPAYVATQANDTEAIEKMAAEALAQLGVEMDPAKAWCDGCLTASDRKCGHTSECEVRACVVERGRANCAHCEDYSCEIIDKFAENAPDARKGLEAIREELSS